MFYFDHGGDRLLELTEFSLPELDLGVMLSWIMRMGKWKWYVMSHWLGKRTLVTYLKGHKYSFDKDKRKMCLFFFCYASRLSFHKFWSSCTFIFIYSYILIKDINVFANIMCRIVLGHIITLFFKNFLYLVCVWHRTCIVLLGIWVSQVLFEVLMLLLCTK